MKLPKQIALYIFSFLVGLIIVFLLEKYIFQVAPSTIVFNDVELKTILNLLISLWFISWLLESFIEILQKIFQIHQKKEDENSSHQIETFAASVGFISGIVIAWSGVHTIGMFFSLSEQATYFEKLLFNSMDAILTASVIAGGSKGIHELTNAYKGIMQAIKNQAINNQSSSQL